MAVRASHADTGSTAAKALIALVATEGSAPHRYTGSDALLRSSESARNLADAVHHLCELHGRHPGVVDHAASRATGDQRKVLHDLAEHFSRERGYLAQLVVAVGPTPSTPGQADTEAVVRGQHRALEMLSQSDRSGCGLGAALATIADWNGIRPLLDAAARRFGVDTQPTRLPALEMLLVIASNDVTGLAFDRAMLFGAQQVVAQHRGLWDLLEARALARLHSFA